MTEQRRLAAILVADVVGYSKLMGSDEAGTLAQLEALRTEIIEPQIAKHAGRLFKSVGDGFLIEFASAVQAVSCAKAIQEANDLGRLPLRIGIHVGDVVVQGDDLMGDGVNVAARIEGIADPGGIAITRAVHEQVRDKLDLGFMDKGEIELKNIQRPVQVFVIGGAKVDGQATALPLPDKPSIAVLPFQNMSGDPEQEYFADGMVEDIITALSRIPSLFVIARNSSFAYKGKAIDIRQVGRELGVRYVLEGSVRKAGNRLRITGQLVEAETGLHLWADKFDSVLEDVFDLQDRVTMAVAGAIEPSVTQAEIRRANRKPTENLQAYDWLVARARRATAVFARRLRSCHGNGAPRHRTRSALCAGLRLSCRLDHFPQDHGWMQDEARGDGRGRALCSSGGAVGTERSARANRCGVALGHLDRDLATAISWLDRAIALNPNSHTAFGLGAVCGTCWATTQPRLITPTGPCVSAHSIPIPTCSAGARTGHLCQRQLPEAVPWLSKAAQQNPRTFT